MVPSPVIRGGVPPDCRSQGWHKVTAYPVFDIEKVVGTGDAWALIKAADQAWNGLTGDWVTILRTRTEAMRSALVLSPGFLIGSPVVARAAEATPLDPPAARSDLRLRQRPRAPSPGARPPLPRLRQLSVVDTASQAPDRRRRVICESPLISAEGQWPTVMRPDS